MLSEKAEVGKTVSKNIRTSLLVTAITLPTIGAIYAKGTDARSVRSNNRISVEERTKLYKNIINKELNKWKTI